MNPRVALGGALVACVAASLLAGIAGGLLRVGIALPVAADAPWLTRAALSHAALMMCGFMGTVISIERAVAFKHAGAWLAPLSSGLAALALLADAPQLAALLFVLGSGVFVTVNVLLLRKQPAAHTALLLASAVAWFTGNVLLALGASSTAVLPWWFAFLVVTIAAERLEMTRLMRRRPGAQLALHLVLALLAWGAALSALAPRAGGVLFGAALCALSGWLLAFDIARRTVRAEGLSRYMAVCLLSGYVWLAIAGVAWACTALGLGARDIALHALGLGFIVSMIMGHAPVILPAVTRVKLQWGNFFYLPLAALHLSLIERLAAGSFNFQLRAQGALFNALAIALFAATAVGAALAWRQRHGPRRVTSTRP
ncbi:MAG TPA: hypothetical protein VFM98_25105 [Ramlibacter sp.]|uniref:hypothetical protein n=1 Tax=Ramlibacter sp. TaxID=1917967 RepID=UPI002D80F965|nr:hypothetical protein [Ramlibacter sp.]HET8748896.1 hypothetical protein [Ramlibacter sp.]